MESLCILGGSFGLRVEESGTCSELNNPKAHLDLVLHVSNLLLFGLNLPLQLLDLVVQHKLEFLQLLQVAPVRTGILTLIIQ